MPSVFFTVRPSRPTSTTCAPSWTSREQDVHVALVVQDQPCGRGDLTFGQDAGRHLVQEWLEKVVLGPRDDGHVNTRVFDSPGRGQPTESRTDDRNAMSAHDERPSGTSA